MASEEDLDLNPEDDEESSGGSNKKLMITIIAVLILGGGAAAFFLMGGEDSEEGAESVEEVKVEETVTEGKGDAIYVSVPSGILAQIKSGKRKMTLQIQIDMLIRNAADEAHLVQHMPVIENDLLLFFSSANADELKTPEGKKKLRDGSLKIIQDIMKDKTGQTVVEAVLFTGFVMQR